MKLYDCKGTCQPSNLIYKRYYTYGRFKSLFCPHLHSAHYTRSTGPSYMDDAFGGHVCTDCGTILSEQQVY